MQTEQINDVCWLKYTILFHVIEKSVKKMTNANKEYNYLFRVAQYVDYVQRAQRLCFPLQSTPLCLSIDAATSTFSPPLCDHTLEGHPFLSTAAMKSACTVAAILFVEQLK